jgi:hypothetical protein
VKQQSAPATSRRLLWSGPGESCPWLKLGSVAARDGGGSKTVLFVPGGSSRGLTQDDEIERFRWWVGAATTSGEDGPEREDGERERVRERREWRADGRVGASLMVQMDVSGR